jgi:hypothetical protein
VRAAGARSPASGRGGGRRGAQRPAGRPRAREGAARQAAARPSPLRWRKSPWWPPPNPEARKIIRLAAHMSSQNTRGVHLDRFGSEKTSIAEKNYVGHYHTCYETICPTVMPTVTVRRAVLTLMCLCVCVCVCVCLCLCLCLCLCFYYVVALCATAQAPTCPRPLRPKGALLRVLPSAYSQHLYAHGSRPGSARLCANQPLQIAP